MVFWVIILSFNEEHWYARQKFIRKVLLNFDQGFNLVRACVQFLGF